MPLTRKREKLPKFGTREEYIRKGYTKVPLYHKIKIIPGDPKKIQMSVSGDGVVKFLFKDLNCKYTASTHLQPGTKLKIGRDNIDDLVARKRIQGSMQEEETNLSRYFGKNYDVGKLNSKDKDAIKVVCLPDWEIFVKGKGLKKVKPKKTKRHILEF